MRREENRGNREVFCVPKGSKKQVVVRFKDLQSGDQVFSLGYPVIVDHVEGFAKKLFAELTNGEPLIYDTTNSSWRSNELDGPDGNAFGLT